MKMRMTGAKENRRLAEYRRRSLETRMQEIGMWLVQFPSTHPEWNSKVRELHRLEMKLEAMDRPICNETYDFDRYRVVSN